MNGKLAARIGIPVALFCVGFGLTALFYGVSEKKGGITPAQTAGIADVGGLSVGETVALPELPTLAGGSVPLNAIKGRYLLCCLFSTLCPGCAQDSDLWQDISNEAKRREVAFYLISTDEDQDRVRRFARAYEFENLPVLYDRYGEVASKLKVSVVPQYLLFSANGTVIGRWTGISRLGNKAIPRRTAGDFFSRIPEIEGRSNPGQ